MAAKQKRYRLQAIASTIALVLYSQYIAAEEFNLIKFTGYEGYIGVEQLYDDQSVKLLGPASLSETRKSTQEEINILTHAYIYHPKLLKLDLGMGLALGQNSFDSNDVDSLGAATDRSNSSADTSFNYLARMKFLEEKPYPLTLFYERTHPLVSPSLDDTFAQKNTRYGANFIWRAPIVFSLDTTVSEAKGSRFNYVVDDSVHQTTLRGYRSFGQDGYAQLLSQYSEIDSASGSLSLNITPSTHYSRSSSFDTRYIFGAERQFELAGIASYLTQGSSPNLTETRFNPYLKWQHTATLSTQYRVDYAASNYDTSDVTATRYLIGLSDVHKTGLTQSYDVHFFDNTRTGVEDQTKGGLASLQYYLPFKDGHVQFGAGLQYDARDQTAGSTTSIKVVNERHVLTGISPVNLSHEFRVTTAGASRVYNVLRTQEFNEGTDYLLVEIANVTQIQRLAGGNIKDGEEISIDYSYQSGGTFSQDTTDQSYQIDLGVFKYYSMFVRYRNNDKQLLEGTSDNKLNSFDNTSYGVGMNYPLAEGINLSLDTSYERQNEINALNNASYDRQSQNADLQFLLSGTSSIDISARRTNVDQLNSQEDVDLTRYGVRLTAQPGLRTIVTYSYDEEEDVGGTLHRKRQEHVFNVTWRYREVRLKLDMRVIAEQQGDFERTREAINLSIRRDFSR